MDIKQTTQYDMFTYVQGNRPVTKSAVNLLAKSIANNNLLHLAPILVNKSMQVIDGQHRLEAAKYLKVPIFYMTDAEASSEEAKVLNTVTHKWALRHFINLYAERHNADYVQLQQVCADYGCAPVVAAALLNNSYFKSAGLRGGLQLLIKQGQFKVVDYNVAETILEELLKIGKYVKSQLVFNREFVVAYMTLRKQVKPEVFLKALDKTNTMIEMKASWRQYVEAFEKVYYRAYKKSIHLF